MHNKYLKQRFFFFTTGLFQTSARNNVTKIVMKWTMSGSLITMFDACWLSLQISCTCSSCTCPPPASHLSNPTAPTVLLVMLPVKAVSSKAPLPLMLSLEPLCLLMAIYTEPRPTNAWCFCLMMPAISQGACYFSAQVIEQHQYCSWSDLGALWRFYWGHSFIYIMLFMLSF